VFNLLTNHNFKFFAVVKDKLEALKYVRQRNQTNPKYRYNGDNLYDSLVSSLFHTRLYKDYQHYVHFASRGKTDRTAALKAALLSVQTRAKALLYPESTGQMTILNATTPDKTVNLQAVDYCLWALQRFYVRKEENFLRVIWPSVSMIYEMDSKTGKKHGETYTRKKHPFGC